MSSTPLVSVTVPTYNAANTLPLALASLVAQTYEHWECIVVDDGSQDHPEFVVARVNDPRIRLIRLPQNRGRAVARQVALDNARGEFLCKLDADDWIYPYKFAVQLAAAKLQPAAGLISTGIAIVNEENELVGVRARGGEAGACNLLGPLRQLGPPPVAHAPSMIRMELAKSIRYDARLRRGEDADYLLQLLLSNRYCVLYDITYAYSEFHSATRRKTLNGYRYRMLVYWKFRRQFPARTTYYVGESVLKWILYGAAFAAKRQGVLLRRRSQQPSNSDMAAFYDARQTVMDVYARLFHESMPQAAMVS